MTSNWTSVDARTYAPRGSEGARPSYGPPSPRQTLEGRMVKTIAVGTDGSDTAQKAVDFALDMAELYKAKIVLASAYVPVAEDRLRKEKTDAPEDIQWSINPSEEV